MRTRTIALGVHPFNVRLTIFLHHFVDFFPMVLGHMGTQPPVARRAFHCYNGISSLRGVPVSLHELDDVKLLSLVGNGEMEALGQLVHRHQDKVLRLAYRMLGRWDLAEDVAQDTFLNLYRAAPRYRPEARFTTWLYRIATNLCLDSRRRERRSPAALPTAAELATPETASTSVEAKERAETVRRAVQDLPERQRIVLVLHRYERLSYFEVSQVTGWSESAVESLLVRAYANLRKSLAEFGKK